jgi:hypothetical protein
VDALRLDFAWFVRPGPAPGDAVVVETELGPPDFDRFGETIASFVTPRNVVYQTDGKTVVDYFGQAVSVLDRARNHLTVRGEDEHLVHEAAYHFVLSRIGEHLDRRRLPRLHGLGLAGREGGVVVLLPSGGGKSTLALQALGDGQVKLISEDSPLLDTHAQLHPFPLRIGVNETDADRLPADGVRIERMEFHPKLVLGIGTFADRIESSPTPLRHLVVGRRSLGRWAGLEPVGRRAAVGPLLREAVVGVGLYQGMEFIFQRGLRDVLGQLDAAAVRAYCCATALARVRTWRLTLGRDHERNWDELRRLLV